MLDELINADLIELTLKDQHATARELEYAYRLRDAAHELELLCQEIAAMQAQIDLNAADDN